MPSDDAPAENGHAAAQRPIGLAWTSFLRALRNKNPGRSQAADGPCSASVLSIADAAKRAVQYRRDGLRVVLTNGCFDLLHRGHVQYLREARALGDILIVGLNSDASVARLKGPGRPVMKIDDRIALLTALRAVDHVVVFEDATAERLVEAIRPKFWVKGGDYRSQYPPEARVAERYGGEFRALAYVTGISTSKVIDNITSNRLA